MVHMASSGFYSLKPQALEPLRNHRGQCLHIQCSEPDISLYLQVTATGWQWLHEPTPAQVTIQGKGSSFIQLLFQKDSGPHTLIQHHVSVVGDTAFLQDCMISLRLSPPDLEHLLTKLTSDIMAETLIRAFQKSKKTLSALFQEKSQDVADFVSFEKELYASSMAFEPFCKDIQQLQDEIEKTKTNIQTLIKEQSCLK